MVQAFQKILKSALLCPVFFSLFLVFVFPLSARPKTETSSIVRRQWVVKLKQNSLMNRRPFQFATPVVENDRLYVGVQRGYFYCVDTQRGKKLWTFQGQGPVYAPAALAGDSVYFADAKGGLYALNKIDGKLQWVAKMDGEIVSAPLIVEDKIIVVTLTKDLYALDRSSGNLLWQTQQNIKDSGFTVMGAANPVFVNGLVLVGYSDGSLVAHDPKDGHVRWSRQLGHRSAEFHDVDATVLVVDSLAYVSSADGHFYAIKPENGEIVWVLPMGSVNSAALKEGLLYVVAGGIVYGLEASSGKTLWEQNLEVTEASAPALYEKWMAVAATKGKIYFLARETGDVVFSWFVKGGSFSHPVAVGNQVFLLSNGSRLYAFQFKK